MDEKLKWYRFVNAVNSLIQNDEISNDEISDNEFSAFFETEPKGESTIQTSEEVKRNGPSAIC